MRALLGEPVRCLVQVGDAKNLRRTLTLSALLAELGVPMVLTLNMHDEAAARGVTVDIAELAEELGAPVLATVATGGEGVAQLITAIGQARKPESLLRYDAEFESHIAAVATAITEMTALIAFQNLSARFNAALDIPAQGLCATFKGKPDA